MFSLVKMSENKTFVLKAWGTTVFFSSEELKTECCTGVTYVSILHTVSNKGRLDTT